MAFLAFSKFPKGGFFLLNQRLRDSSERRSAGDAKKLFLEATHCHSERTFELLFHKISYHEKTRPD